MSKNTSLSSLINYVSANSSGNVTIAAPSSGYALDVSGTGRFTGAVTFSSTITATSVSATDATGSAILTTNGGGEGVLSVNTANPLRFLINGGEKMRITSGGLVGIGTTPSFLLDLYTATSATTSTILRLKNGYNDPSTGLRVKWDFATTEGVYLDVTTDSGGSKAMTLYLSAANATPTQTLQILGSNKAATFNGSVTAAGGLITKGSSFNVNNSIKFLRADGPEMGYIGWSNESVNNSTWLFKSSNGNTIGFSADGTNQNMVITTAGNVGIGTTSPNSNSRLHVYRGGGSYDTIVADGDVGTNTGYAIYEGGSPRYALYSNGAGGNDSFNIYNFGASSNSLTILTSGNVGIGTTSPDAIFHVAKVNSGGLGGQIVIDNPATSTLGNSVEISFLTDAGASGAGTRNARIIAQNENANNGAANMQFWTWNGGTDSERMRITSGGNVGIGTTSPTNRLQVSGNIYSTDTVFARNLKPEAFASVSAGTPTGAGIPLGYSSINITTTTDNNWRAIMTNINDVKGYFWVTLGDAASKDTANYMMAMTSPAYGVSNFGLVSYQDNGWNTGGFEFTTDTTGGSYRLLVRCTSYYSGSGTAYGTIYFLRLE